MLGDCNIIAVIHQITTLSMRRWRCESWREDIQQLLALLQVYPAYHLITASQSQCQAKWCSCAFLYCSSNNSENVKRERSLNLSSQSIMCSCQMSAVQGKGVIHIHPCHCLSSSLHSPIPQPTELPLALAHMAFVSGTGTQQSLLNSS